MTLKGTMSWSAVALVLFSLIGGIVRCGAVDCQCAKKVQNYWFWGKFIGPNPPDPDGCIISRAAPAGFKCECEHVDIKHRGVYLDYCEASAFPCTDTDYCPGNVADYCACKIGGGNCEGYSNVLQDCTNIGKTNETVAIAASCECGEHNGGCFISKPSPLGWKCICSYRCNGWAEQCSWNEICPGNDYSFCACQLGRGYCDGYPDTSTNCSSSVISTSCNCEKTSDWGKGHYTIDKVTYEIGNKTIEEMRPITLGKGDIVTCSGETQTITLTIQEQLSKTSSFSHTKGIALQVGVAFKVGLPEVLEKTFSVRVTGSSKRTWGESETMKSTYTNSFACNGAPRKHTQCSVIMSKAKVNVPYTMQVKHKLIPDCMCQSSGIWSGIEAYHVQLIVKEIGDCSVNVSQAV